MAAALEYVARGWKVIQLHHIVLVAGHCSCWDGPACPSAGKHPIARAWQATFIETPEQVLSAWASQPLAGIGIVTGPASGLWVLDVDPDHGGDDSLRDLIIANGRLPDTHTVQTGSGGLHYYFATAGLDFDLTNARGRMPRGNGLDIRGRGGFVVAPPSVSGRGAYRTLTSWVGGVAVAAGWLIDMLRPAPARERTELYGVDDVARDGQPYAVAAVRAQLAELAACPVGGRNETAFKVACRLVELARAPWARLDWAEIEAAFMAAGAAANVDGHFMDGEVWSVWLKAGRHVKGVAELPPAEHLGSFMAWEDVPGGAAFGSAGQGSANGSGGSALAPEPGVVASDANVAAFEAAVARAGWDLQVREEARRRLDASRAVAVDWGAEVLDDDGLELLAPAVPLVAGVLDLDSLGRMNGPSGHGKSFVALDLAACVATGRDWHGKAVEAVPVLYVAAEGARGLRKRVRAWCEHAGVATSGVRFLPRALIVNGPQWDSFVGFAAKMGAKMIVLDTQARMTVGSNENDNTEMSVIMAGLDVLREATGACVLLIHHRGLAGTHGRGATAVKGALDVELDVTKSGMNVTVLTNKQKDDAEAPPLLLTLNPVGASLVLVGAADPDALGFINPTTTRDVGRERALQLVQVLRREFGAGNGGTRAEIRALYFGLEGIAELSTKARNSAWARAWGRLEEQGRIARNPIAERFRYVEMDGFGDLDSNPMALSEFGWPVAQKGAKASDA